MVLLAFTLSLGAGGAREPTPMAEGAPEVPAYELIQWNSPKPINERISGEQYILPDGWKKAVAGVKKIKVSNFGALQHDPATVANAKRFIELTGIEVELLGWAEPPIVAKTVPIFSAKSDSVDVLCYDHPTTYAQMVGGGWLHPIDAIWDDPNVWKYFAGPLKAGLTAPDGHIYGSIGQTKTFPSGMPIRSVKSTKRFMTATGGRRACWIKSGNLGFFWEPGLPGVLVQIHPSSRQPYSCCPIVLIVVQ